MADSLITQVSRDGRPASATAAPLPPTGKQSRAASSWSIWSLFCCFGRHGNDAKAAAGASGAVGRGPAQNTATKQEFWQEPFPDPGQNLLPPRQKTDNGKKCLVLDLDETLVHSSFKPVPDPDFVVPVEIDGKIHHVFVLKRPHVDKFLERMGQLYEIVLFTASLSKYADPVSDLLDIHKTFRHRLFREHCVYHQGTYVKDLSRLGRDIKEVIIVDNSPASYAFQPQNAVPVESWFDDKTDTELLDLIPFFEEISKATDVCAALR
eukprot:m.111760 g.111760  ORF g.111760 m.111760 type:complete len:265 (-) comp15959_c0_seq2:982-1776(-)